MSKLACVRGFGGFRRFDINFFKEFKQFEVNFFCPSTENLRREKLSYVKLDSKPAYHFDPVYFFTRKNHLLSWITLRNLDVHLKSIDLITTIETYFFISKQCADFSINTRKPLAVLVYQNLPNHFSKKLPPYSWNTRAVCDNASLFVAVSQKAKDYLLSCGVDDGKIKVIPLGVDTECFQPIEHFNAVPRILFVGNLTEYKGLPEVLRACSLLWSTGEKFELWICGEGNLKPLVLQYLKKYPITFFGHVNGPEIRLIYQQCDIFCLPSRNRKFLGMSYWAEQLGFVFLEAMSSGLAIVTSDCGSIQETVGDQNFVVPQGAVTELYEALKTLIHDAKKRKRIGEYNRERVLEHFEVKNQIVKVESEFLKLVN